jgi:hypothetical protein
MIAGPKNHCVTKTHIVVASAHLAVAWMRLRVIVGRSVGPREGCVKAKRKNAIVVQNQPLLTKKTLKMFLFCAKYDGAEEGG